MCGFVKRQDRTRARVAPFRVEAAQAQDDNTIAKPKRREREPAPAPMTVPIYQTEREGVLCQIRQLFSDGKSCDRDAAIRDLARVLGYERLGPHVREVLNTDVVTAVRRGFLQNDVGELSLHRRGIEDYQRDFLKDQFLASLGGTWTDRKDAIRAFARARFPPNGSVYY